MTLTKSETTPCFPALHGEWKERSSVLRLHGCRVGNPAGENWERLATFSRAKPYGSRVSLASFHSSEWYNLLHHFSARVRTWGHMNMVHRPFAVHRPFYGLCAIFGLCTIFLTYNSKGGARLWHIYKNSRGRN